MLRQPLLFVSILCLTLLFAATPATAGLVYESATLGPVPDWMGYPLLSNQILGARFNISEPTQVTAIGGHLYVGVGSGSIFGAIVALNGPNALPQGALLLPEEVVASTVFVGPYPSSDFRTSLSVMLAPGTYGLVFGSGQFGATGWGHMISTNTDLPGASYFWSNGSWWSNGGIDSVRFVVEGDPAVPEPATGALAGLALCALVLVRFRRRLPQD